MRCGKLVSDAVVASKRPGHSHTGRDKCDFGAPNAAKSDFGASGLRPPDFTSGSFAACSGNTWWGVCGFAPRTEVNGRGWLHNSTLVPVASPPFGRTFSRLIYKLLILLASPTGFEPVLSS